MRGNILKQIREDFKDHKATLTEFDGVQVVRWAKEGTNNYSMNVIYQSNCIHINGDLGEAVYSCTWKTNYKNCASETNLDYLTGKLSCINGGKTRFDTDECIKDIKNWYEYHSEDYGYDEEELKELKEIYLEALRYTEHEYEWIPFVMSCDDKYVDFESSLYDAGNKTNPRIYCYWVALKMIAEYLDGDKSN